MNETRSQAPVANVAGNYTRVSFLRAVSHSVTYTDETLRHRHEPDGDSVKISVFIIYY